jgi:peptide/nickel transport system ATP-binding protein
MRQRVMIAMALACNPPVVIADEPTTALDVMVQAQILRLLAKMRDEAGVALILITHDLSMLTEVVDRVAVMYAGRIVEEGPASAVLRDPQHPYAQALVGAFPTIGDPTSRRVPLGIAGDPPDPSERPPGCSFNPRCPAAFDRCLVDDPSLLDLPGGRAAACHLVEQSP